MDEMSDKKTSDISWIRMIGLTYKLSKVKIKSGTIVDTVVYVKKYWNQNRPSKFESFSILVENVDKSMKTELSEWTGQWKGQKYPWFLILQLIIIRSCLTAQSFDIRQPKYISKIPNDSKCENLSNLGKTSPVAPISYSRHLIVAIYSFTVW